MIAALSLLLAATAGASPTQQVEILQCGAANLRMTSHGLAGETAPLAPARQTLTRRLGAKQVAVPLERGGKVVVQGHAIPDRYVASWACIPGSRRTHYVLIGYACAVDPSGPKECGGDKEWFRLLDERGRFADAGVPRDGPARDRLNTRLGIADAMAAGVSMTPIVK